MLVLAKMRLWPSEVSTRLQGKSKDWFKERQKRLTSSLFGGVTNRRESIAPVSIVASINKTSTSTSRMSPLLKWGIDNEHVAHEMCKSKSGEEVADCGLIINPSWPLLACSPNSIVYREANPIRAIEIKCPFSNKEMTIEECCKDSSFYLKKKFRWSNYTEAVTCLLLSVSRCSQHHRFGLDWLCCICEERFFFVQRIPATTAFGLYNS